MAATVGIPAMVELDRGRGRGAALHAVEDDGVDPGLGRDTDVVRDAARRPTLIEMGTLYSVTSRISSSFM